MLCFLRRFNASQPPASPHATRPCEGHRKPHKQTGPHHLPYLLTSSLPSTYFPISFSYLTRAEHPSTMGSSAPATTVSPSSPPPPVTPLHLLPSPSPAPPTIFPCSRGPPMRSTAMPAADEDVVARASWEAAPRRCCKAMPPPSFAARGGGATRSGQRCCKDLASELQRVARGSANPHHRCCKGRRRSCKGPPTELQIPTSGAAKGGDRAARDTDGAAKIWC
jgi:hypothetical protein